MAVIVEIFRRFVEQVIFGKVVKRLLTMASKGLKHYFEINIDILHNSYDEIILEIPLYF